MGRWFGSKHTSCQNCNMPDEDAEHLLHCQDSGRFSLFRSEVNKLAAWLQQSHMDPTLATILTDYVLSRGARRFDALDMSAKFHQFAFSQDMIGWDNFMLGKVSIFLRPIQHSHLLCSPSMFHCYRKSSCGYS